MQSTDYIFIYLSFGCILAGCYYSLSNKTDNDIGKSVLISVAYPIFFLVMFGFKIGNFISQRLQNKKIIEVDFKIKRVK